MVSLQDKKIKDLLFALGTNGLNFIFGIITSLVIPIMLSINDYALLRTYLLYIGFVGLASLGFNDGLYLKYGKYNYEDIPKEKFRSLFFFLLIFQLGMSILLFVILIFFIGIQDYRYVLITFFVSITSIILNLDTFLNFVNQFTKRFHISFVNNILSKTFIVISVLIILFINKENYISFILVYFFSYFIILISNLVKNSELVFGKRETISSNKTSIVTNIKEGFLLMMGSYIAILILGISQFLVQYFFKTEDFAMFAFSLSILNIIYIFIRAISTVMYPYLARVKKDNMGKIYLRMQSFLTLAIGFSFISYFIIEFLIRNYIYKYVASLDILLFLFPITLFNSIYNVISFNFYKVIGNQKQLIKNNLVVLIISLVNLSVWYITMKSITLIALSTLINYIIWVLITDKDFVKILKINLTSIHIKQMILTLSFITIASIFDSLKGLIIYIIFYFVFVVILMIKDVRSIFRNKLNYFIT